MPTTRTQNLFKFFNATVKYKRVKKSCKKVVKLIFLSSIILIRVTIYEIIVKVKYNI